MHHNCKKLGTIQKYCYRKKKKNGGSYFECRSGGEKERRKKRKGKEKKEKGRKKKRIINCIKFNIIYYIWKFIPGGVFQI